MGYPAELETIDIVFSNPPGPGVRSHVERAIREHSGPVIPALRSALLRAADEGCEFVETEDAKGRGIGIGEWVQRDDGYHVLRIEVNAAKIRRST